MSTLYLDEPGAALHRRGETLVVIKDDAEIAELELCDLQQVVICAHSSLTSAALQALVTRRGCHRTNGRLHRCCLTCPRSTSSRPCCWRNCTVAAATSPPRFEVAEILDLQGQ